MKQGYKMVRECAMHAPYLLDDIRCPKLQKIADKYLPVSTGIEYSVNLDLPDYHKLSKLLNKNESILEMNFDLSTSFDSYITEIKIRYKSGIKGLQGIYTTLEFFKKYSELNPKAGFHYHIDLCRLSEDIKKELRSTSDRFDLSYLSRRYFLFMPLEKFTQYLKDSWNYTGHFNNGEEVFSGIKKSPLEYRPMYKGTSLEFRIGSMSFDYNKVIKQVIQAHRITNECIANAHKVWTKNK